MYYTLNILLPSAHYYIRYQKNVLRNHIFLFVFRESLAPYWIEWLLLIWISGLLLGELISPQDKSGLGMIKIVVIVLNLVSHHS